MRSLPIVLILIGNTALWSATITVGDHELQANTSGQIVEIFVEGGEAVPGVDLFVQIGDGGPALSTFGLPSGYHAPALTNVELIDGTIFDGITDAPTNIGAPELDQVAFYTLALIGAAEAVPANGILAKLTVDTSGFYGGSWDLMLDQVLPFAEFNGPYTTNFAGVLADITNGQISIAVSIGDIDDDGQFGIDDIDALTGAIQMGISDSRFDVNEDGVVNSSDRVFWIETVARTYFGDSNLDGEFNSSDLVDVFQANEYEDGIALNSTWHTGDWNGDGDFSTADLVVAFQSRAFEQGRRRGLVLVPEPSCVRFDSIMIIVAMRFLSRWRSR
ncbi:hypothetical protein ACFL2H_03170 [Planctomycetota bacterium]